MKEITVIRINKLNKMVCESYDAYPEEVVENLHKFGIDFMYHVRTNDEELKYILPELSKIYKDDDDYRYYVHVSCENMNGDMNYALGVPNPSKMVIDRIQREMLSSASEMLVTVHELIAQYPHMDKPYISKCEPVRITSDYNIYTPLRLTSSNVRMNIGICDVKESCPVPNMYEIYHPHNYKEEK